MASPARIQDKPLAPSTADDTVLGVQGGVVKQLPFGFTPAGVGSVTRTTQDKLREFVSVRDFGAVGDGVADDTVALQAALDSVERCVGAFNIQTKSRGGTILFPAGSYRVTDTIHGRAGTKILGAGPNRTRIVSELSSGNVISFIGAEGGSVDPVEIEDLAVVQQFGAAHASGYAISIDGNGYGTTPRLRNLMTQDTHGGIYLDWCFPGSLDNCHSFRHAIEGFRTTFDCTSLTFQNCYAGANAGSGFKLAGHYIATINCASDSNGLDGYEFYYDGGASTGMSMISCGTEACLRDGISSDRIASLSIIAPRILTASAGLSCLKFDSGDAISVISPVLSSQGVNANPCINISNASGAYPSNVQIIGWSGGAANYATAINQPDYVSSQGSRIGMAYYNGNLRIGGIGNFNRDLQVFQIGSNFPAGAGGTSYGANYVPVVTAALTLAGTAHYKPVVNAPALTVARLIAGPYIDAPTITAGTVTRHEGMRIADQPAGSSADAGLVIGDATVPAGRWSLFNGSSRKSLFAAGLQWGSPSGPQDLFGAGSPENVVSAAVGSTYRRTDGGSGTAFYIKESGSGSTGWIAK